MCLTLAGEAAAVAADHGEDHEEDDDRPDDDGDRTRTPAVAHGAEGDQTGTGREDSATGDVRLHVLSPDEQDAGRQPVDLVMLHN
mgnify:CR=1 FL=1